MVGAISRSIAGVLTKNGLEQGRWDELRHAHGPATDVPGLLTGLRSGDLEAAAILHETLWHQGTVYSASAATLPYLFEILAETPDSAKGFVVSLVCCIATGEWWIQHGLRSYGNEASYRNALEAQGRSLDDERLQEVERLASIREQVLANLAALHPYIDASEGLGEIVQAVFELHSDIKKMDTTA